MTKGLNNYDSSDEELLKKHEKEFNSHLNDEVIKELSAELGAPKHQIVKSLVIHNIGRMALHTPQIDREYRKRKAQHLPEKTFLKKPSTADGQGGIQSVVANEISMKDLGGEVVGLEGLSALGRFLRRSQIRSYKNINEVENAKLFKERDYKREQRIDVIATITSKNKRQTVEVREILVANYNGLGGSSFPNTDMVLLEGKSGRGDYSSAYKDNSSNYGKANVDQVVNASSKLEPDELRSGQHESLQQAIDTLGVLKDEIAKKHPQQDSDAFIAELIRKVCMAEPLSEGLGVDITKRIYALTYLLFKTEVIRSPGALVSHVQMLELIINREMSLEDAFSKTQMPMASSGAIKAARLLEDKYNKHLFYQYDNPYSYAHGYEDKFTPAMLVQKESDLVDKWLKLKFGEEAESVVNNPEKHLVEIYREINRSLQSFGLDIRLEAFHRAMTEPEKPEEIIQATEKEIDKQQQLQSKSPTTEIDDKKEDVLPTMPQTSVANPHILTKDSERQM